MPISNVVAGFILAAPMLKTFGGKETIEKVEQKLSGFSGTIGVFELVIGVIALLGNMGMTFGFYIYSTPLQALVAIAIGLILSANLFEKYPSMHNFIVKLKQNAEWIGLVGIVVGLLAII